MNGKGFVLFCVKTTVAMINLHAYRKSVIKNTFFLAVNLLMLYSKHGRCQVISNIRLKG